MNYHEESICQQLSGMHKGGVKARYVFPNRRDLLLDVKERDAAHFLHEKVRNKASRDQKKENQGSRKLFGQLWGPPEIWSRSVSKRERCCKGTQTSMSVEDSEWEEANFGRVTNVLISMCPA